MELYVTKMLVGNDEQHSHSGLVKFKSAFQGLKLNFQS